MNLKMSDEVSIYVKQSGEGPYCIYIHGGPGAWSYDFEALGGNSLENSMSLVYFDQRGCGRSGGNSNSDYSINRLIEDIEEIRKQLNIEKWIVLAHSFGGIIAVNYVHKYQQFVEGLIFLNCTLSMEDSLKSQIDYGTKLLGKENLQLEPYKHTLEKWRVILPKLNEKNLFFKLQYNEYDNFIKVNSIGSEVRNRNFSMASQAFKNYEYYQSYYELTKYISIPVLVVCGNKDYSVGPDHYKNFHFQNAKVSIVDGRHVLYLENKEEFREMIKDFIENLHT